MDRLTEELSNHIFNMKHNLEYRNVIEELINLRIRIKSADSRFTYYEVKGMIYIHEGVIYPSLNYNNMNCSCYKILELINSCNRNKNRRTYDLIFGIRIPRHSFH